MNASTFAKLFVYGIVASIGLIFDFGLVILFKEVFGLHYLIAVCIGFTVGLVITFVLSNRFVFGTPKSGKSKLFILFGVIGVGGLVLLNLLVWLMTDGLGINYIISKAIATIAVFMWNFFARKSLYQDGG